MLRHPCCRHLVSDSCCQLSPRFYDIRKKIAAFCLDVKNSQDEGLTREAYEALKDKARSQGLWNFFLPEVSFIWVGGCHQQCVCVLPGRLRDLPKAWKHTCSVTATNRFNVQVSGLTVLEYAPIAEMLGAVPLANRCMNCSAPDTGNMEVLEKFGNPEQKREWLEPLLNQDIRSCFAMTEPVCSAL